MSKRANAGKLNTPVVFKKKKTNLDKEAYKKQSEESIFGKDENGKDIPVWGKWTNVHGTEVFKAMQLELKEPVTFITRYSPLLCDNTLIAYKIGDPKPFEVISIDNVENRCEWLEIKLQRQVTAR